MNVEERLVAAFRDARTTIEPNRDLFSRVASSLEADRLRRRWRRRVYGVIAGYLAVIVAIAAAGSDYDNKRIVMDWWLLELLTTIVLVTIATVLGPFIKRFGRSYAADVFRANPRTGKSYLVLTDVAYYLIFTSFILFTIRFEPKYEWFGQATADQLQDEVGRVGGMLLLLGALHGANIVMLPVIGRLLSLNRKLDDGENGTPAAGGGVLPPGAYVLRIEPLGAQAPASDER
ncbi:MAG: hypothetical protein AB7L13_20370 [Acidimicrobiia bacterium]